MSLLGIDYGEKRIGLATAEPEVGVALPLPAAVHARPADRIASILQIVRERKIEQIVVGYPFNMDGSIGFKAREVDAFIAKLEAAGAPPVARMDERLSSHAADQAVGRDRRSTKKRLRDRKAGMLDSRAAALILQDWLDREQSRI
jgi:putative Holliday junction resolvase